jgi:spore germination protein GerM
MKSIPIIIDNLKENNNNYHGLKGIIPKDTKINDFKIENGILSIDFSKELLNVNKDIEEKIIESLVYSLLSLKEINGIKISIDKEPLKFLPNTNIMLDDILTKTSIYCCQY